MKHIYNKIEKTDFTAEIHVSGYEQNVLYLFNSKNRKNV